MLSFPQYLLLLNTIYLPALIVLLNKRNFIRLNVVHKEVETSLILKTPK